MQNVVSLSWCYNYKEKIPRQLGKSKKPRCKVAPVSLVTSLKDSRHNPAFMRLHLCQYYSHLASASCLPGLHLSITVTLSPELLLHHSS